MFDEYTYMFSILDTCQSALQTVLLQMTKFNI